MKNNYLLPIFFQKELKWYGHVPAFKSIWCGQRLTNKAERGKDSDGDKHGVEAPGSNNIRLPFTQEVYLRWTLKNE